MSWTRLTRAQVRSRIAGVSVRISPAGQGSPRLTIRIAAAVARGANIPTDRHSTVDLLIGEGPEAGRMRIVASDIGAFACHRSGKKAALRIVAVQPPGAPDKWPGTPCEAETANGEITFALPWQEEAAESRKAAPKGVTSSGSDASRAVRAVEEFAERKRVEPSKPAAAPTRAPAPAPIERKRTFRHGKETVALSHRHCAMADKLYTAMSKGLGFIPYENLMAAGHVRTVDDLSIEMHALGKEIAPLKLDVKEERKMGYYMRPLGNGARG